FPVGHQRVHEQSPDHHPGRSPRPGQRVLETARHATRGNHHHHRTDSPRLSDRSVRMTVLAVMAVAFFALGVLSAIPAMALEIAGVITFERAEPFAVAGMLFLMLSVAVGAVAMGTILVTEAFA